MRGNVAKGSDKTRGDTLIPDTSFATPTHAQSITTPRSCGCVSDTVVCGTPATYSPRACRALRWTGSRSAADPRGPVSDSLRSLIDGARTVGASRVTTRGLLELAYDICSQSASITDVQAVRTCPLSDGFPVRNRSASTGSPARAGATWCTTTPRGGTLRSTGAAAGSLPRPASGPLRPVALSRCQQRAERLPQLS